MECKGKKFTIYLFFLSFLLLLVLTVPGFVYGNASSVIDTTVKISVCGNELIESGEDCEGSNLNDQTCVGLGYTSGVLTCDISCSFDIHNCISLPTSTPIPSSSSGENSSTIISMPTSVFSPTLVSQATLPETLFIYDFDKNGKIDIKEVYDVIKIWVKEWNNFKMFNVKEENTKNNTEKCDLNNDGKCDLKDFSILLYYIGK